MAKHIYTWSNETIRERYYECIELWYKETDKDLKELYFKTANDLMNYLNTTTTQIDYPLLETYNFEKDILNSLCFLWKDFQDFSNANKTAILNIPRLKQTSLSPKDILDLTHDFYKSLDPYIFNYFMKSFRMRKNHIRFVSQEQEDNFAGINIHLPYRDEAFVEIVRENTINDIITTIHEYAHLTSYSINIFNKLNPNFYYTEIISLFFELLGADFLGSQFGIDKSTILKAENHNTMSEFADITSYKIDLITFESLFFQGYTKNKDIKLIGRDFLNLNSEKVNYLFKNENVEISDYVIGYIIALELYYIYLEDKEKAMFILKKMLLYSAKSKLDYYNNIKKLGIIPNQHIKEYVATLKSDVLKLSRKQN